MPRGDLEVKITINDADVKRKLDTIGRRTKQGEKDIVKVMRSGAKIWADTINVGTMYRHINKESGGSFKPMGTSAGYSKRRREYWSKTRAKTPRDKDSNGWRAHFFATPARQIRKIKRVPFLRYYSAKTATVKVVVSRGIAELIKQYFVSPKFKK